MFDAIEAARARGHDVVICDTAGRLHTQQHLMDELRKVRKVIARQAAGAPHETLLTIDATTGQNGLRQALLFREAVDVTGIALTKLDGTAKGGIALAIAQELGVPVKLIGTGEALEDLRPFDPDDFAKAILEHVSGPADPRGPGTRVVRAGLPAPEQGEPFLPGPVFAAPFHVTGDPSDAPHSYAATRTRPSSATRRRSASSRTPRRCCSRRAWRPPRRCSHGLRPGDALAIDSRPATSACAAWPRPTWSRAAWRCGWRRRRSLADAARGARLLWLETPSNPKLEVYDIAALSALARGRGAHGRGQHHRRAAAPAAARPRRRRGAHERDQADDRPRRPDARLPHDPRP